MTRVPPSKWRWFGCAGHFVAAANCRFHLHTRVGDYRISSVGDYHPSSDRAGAPQEIGLRRLFETFVFRVSGEEPDGEGMVDAWSEVDSLVANTEADATANHMTLCRKYAGGTTE